MDGTNPGQQLRDLLKRIYPLDSENTNSSEDNSFVSRIDNALIAEGNFSNLVYESSINYLLRRLINTAEYLRRKYESDVFPPEKFLFELRRFITENTHIEVDKVEIILSLLKLCIDAKDKQLKPSRKKRIFKNAKEKDELCCYICGNALNVERVSITEDKELKNREEVEVEHIWPKTMGGATEDFNLKLSCSYCNKAKKKYIDATDFHYEQMCLVSDKNDQNFSSEFEKEYRIAISAKSNYSCSVCGKPALTVGPLNFARLNPDDSWHFLNIAVYCDEHTPD
ncbi:HNH endonuclease [Anabaena cylindrica FACHB-243]|uniref:HNH domain-containing protein n=1 Tax=Anabaena cylindrica (strain ATCC 27899 / PCC 7122) TaxID=272123 RepID=K9ZN50_ANACC|nr:MULTISPECIES: HNH endonuclease [Anabaena]AFZ60199.1 hypothetical protein Anacy_4856 [Anabaena cylindrica PCC 7122]MBD2417748.1 HNH endonuclease [Anabaena cylindrica FACHB-243]MBY5282622.1 HNH endonuclease [Anabaena sp. CCAP 1446/1C]MBY5310488.1 HNH endonuclease [Anabaena sp. CCAP 1446/1C]MCM2404663.1 HNH endonuclease [Anabaena sp. CCAP 1446/1C]